MSAPLMGPPSDRPTYVLTGFSGGLGCLASIAVRTNTWLPHTTGELQLRPGMSIFQATLSVALHVSGSFGSSGTTPALVPRNCGHCCAPAVVATRRHVKTPMTVVAERVMGGEDTIGSSEIEYLFIASDHCLVDSSICSS